MARFGWDVTGYNYLDMEWNDFNGWNNFNGCLQTLTDDMR